MSNPQALGASQRPRGGRQGAGMALKPFPRQGAPVSQRSAWCAHLYIGDRLCCFGDTSTVEGGEGHEPRSVWWLGASASLVFVQICKCWTSVVLTLPARCPGWLGACTLHQEEAARARERRERIPGVGPPVTPWKGETPKIFLEALRREMELSCVGRPRQGPEGPASGPEAGGGAGPWAAEPLGHTLSGSGMINNDTTVVLSTHDKHMS